MYIESLQDIDLEDELICKRLGLDPENPEEDMDIDDDTDWDVEE